MAASGAAKAAIASARAMSLRRGDVHWALSKPRSGSEQSGRCPVVVVSHDIFNSAASWLCHQVTTLDREKLGERIGRLPDDYLREVERGLMAALQIGAFAS